MLVILREQKKNKRIIAIGYPDCRSPLMTLIGTALVTQQHGQKRARVAWETGEGPAALQGLEANSQDPSAPEGREDGYLKGLSKHELWQLSSWRRALMNFPAHHYNFMGIICFALWLLKN